jgi:hypothetical protein
MRLRLPLAPANLLQRGGGLGPGVPVPPSPGQRRAAAPEQAEAVPEDFGKKEEQGGQEERFGGGRAGGAGPGARREPIDTLRIEAG